METQEQIVASSPVQAVERKATRYADAYARFVLRTSRPPTQAELAAEVGVSRQAVEQLHIKVLFADNAKLCVERTRQKWEALITGGKTAKEIAAETTYSETAVRYAAKRFNLPLKSCRTNAQVRIIEAHKDLTKKLGRLPSKTEFAKWAYPNQKHGVAAATCATAVKLGLEFTDGRKL